MRVNFTAWSKDLGPHQVVNKKIDKNSIADSIFPLPAKAIRVAKKIDNRWKRNSIQIAAKTTGPIALHKEYLVTIDISEDELICLIQAMYPVNSARELLSRLEEVER